MRGKDSDRDRGWEATRALRDWSPSLLEDADDDDRYMYGADSGDVEGSDGDGTDEVGARKKARVGAGGDASEGDDATAAGGGDSGLETPKGKGVKAGDGGGEGEGEGEGEVEAEEDTPEAGIIQAQVGSLPNFGPIADLCLGLSARSEEDLKEVRSPTRPRLCFASCTSLIPNLARPTPPCPSCFSRLPPPSPRPSFPWAASFQSWLRAMGQGGLAVCPSPRVGFGQRCLCGFHWWMPWPPSLFAAAGTTTTYPSPPALAPTLVCSTSSCS
jgi:hypothetical protein